jgi:hypothetical protein
MKKNLKLPLAQVKSKRFAVAVFNKTVNHNRKT